MCVEFFYAYFSFTKEGFQCNPSKFRRRTFIEEKRKKYGEELRVVIFEKENMYFAYDYKLQIKENGKV